MRPSTPAPSTPLALGPALSEVRTSPLSDPPALPTDPAPPLTQRAPRWRLGRAELGTRADRRPAPHPARHAWRLRGATPRGEALKVWRLLRPVS